MNVHRENTIVIQKPTALTLMDHLIVLASMAIMEMVLFVKV